jgi:membrane associated rhomboid family serine protease
MGIYDRDYVRREGSSFFGPILERGTVCKTLIFSTVGAFILVMLLPKVIFPLLCLSLPGIASGHVWQVFTYAFIYFPNSPWPILWDMLFLWWFGRELEDIYGPKEFLAFYLAIVLLSAGVYLLFPFLIGVAATFPLFGASTAVLAVLVLAACHFPRKTINLFFILPVPIWLVAVVDVGLQVFNFLSLVGPNESVGGMAGIPAAFLAAAGFALLYYKNQWRVSTLWPDFSGWRRKRNRPRLRLHVEEEDEPVTPVPVVPSGAPEEEQLEAKMDAILEKISRTGKESLTESERETLLRASEAIRRRRS